MQEHEPTVIRTGYNTREDLSIYIDGFLKGQAVAAALIGERLVGRGFHGVESLVAEVLELRRYRFHARDDDADGGRVPCPACGRLAPPL